MDTRRLESFSDGVFAVAITVLVFNLLTIGDHGPLTSHVLLGQSWPRYAAYAVGFVTIGIMWLNHHTMLAHLHRVDRTVLVLNIFLLLAVVAVPFPTALVAGHLGSADPGARAAAVAYGVIGLGMGACFSAMWLYVTRRRDRLGGSAMPASRSATVRFSAGSIGYVAGILAAVFDSPTAAVIIYAAVGVYYLFEQLPSPTGPDSPDPDSPGTVSPAG